MIRFLKLLIVILLILISAVSLSASEGTSSKAEEFDAIKLEIQNLLDENKRLTTEQALLRQEAVHLQELIELKKQSLQAIDPASSGYSSGDNRTVHVQSVKKELSQTEDELLLEKTKNAYLAGKALDAELHGDLWKLKLTELQYKKRELEMELELREAKAEDQFARHGSDRSVIKNNIARITSDIKALDEASARLLSEADGFDNELFALERDNEYLEQDIKRIEQRIYFTKKENDIMKDKLTLANKSSEVVVENKRAEEAVAREEVQALDKKYAGFSNEVNRLMSFAELKKKYISEIVEIDKENNSLREQISDLTVKIEELTN